MSGVMPLTQGLVLCSPTSTAAVTVLRWAADAASAAALANNVVTLYLTNCTPLAVPMTPMHWRFDIWQH